MTEEKLGTAMKSIGECMAIGRNFKESFQKAVRSLEVGLNGLDSNKIIKKKKTNQLIDLLRENRPNKFLVLAECLRKKISLSEIIKASNYDPWFIREISEIIDTENLLKQKKISPKLYLLAKEQGFSDEKIIELSCSSESKIRKIKATENLHPAFKNIDTCSGEFESKTHVLIMELHRPNQRHEETKISPNKKVIILGGGPNRIGQGIEFDYCCVHSSFAVKELGIESIMINCNRTVSTDYDISDRLYFEPLDKESVIEI